MNNLEIEFFELKNLAEKGDASAQTQLGNFYFYGKVVSEDHNEAIRWYRMAADQRFTPGMTLLALVYNKLEVYRQDAVRLLREAAEMEYAYAQAHLGIWYLNGINVEEDFAEALKLFRLADKQGEPKAKSYLGVMYSRGQGVKQDLDRALSYIQSAAEQGEETAQLCLGSLYYTGNGVPEDIIYAYCWYWQAAVQGDEDGEFEARNLAMEMTPEQIIQAVQLALAYMQLYQEGMLPEQIIQAIELALKYEYKSLSK